MAINENTTIGAKTVFDPDYIFDEAALPNATTSTSSAFEIGGSQNALEIVGIADTETVVGDGETLKYELYTATTSTGAYTLSDTLVSYTPSGTTTTIDADTQMFRFSPTTDTKQWGKVVITATENQSGETSTVYIDYVSR